MNKSSIVWVVVAVVVLAGGAWWWMGMNQASAPAAPAGTGTDATPTGAGTMAPLTLNTMTSPTLGTYLVATNGMTLYHYTKDSANISTCTGQCAVAWPPYTVTTTDVSTLKGGMGVNGAIGMITRADGATQVTYKGVPLYFWEKDVKSGDTTGQGVAGVWFVVKP